MSRVRPREFAGEPKTAKLNAAQKRDAKSEFDALVAMTDCCEWCFRHRPLSPHHAAQGFRPQTEFMVRLLCLLCLECHRDVHRECAENGRALSLAIIYHAARGNNIELFWEITKRNWPDKALVELWIKRICRIQSIRSYQND